MSFPAVSDEACPTPNRATRLEIHVPEKAVTRQTWFYQRDADQIARDTDLSLGSSENVELVPGFGWILHHRLTDRAKTLLTSEGGGAFVDIAHINVPNGDSTVERIFQDRRPADLPGVTIDPDLGSNRWPTLIRRIGAGSSWGNELDADAAAYPGPVLPSAHVKMARIISGLVTYPANQGFSFSFVAPPNASAFDTLYTFYFGGPADITPDTVIGGEFCLALRGSGDALLFERESLSPSVWRKRHEFRWATGAGAVPAGMTWVQIQPLWRNRIIFRTVHKEKVGDDHGPTDTNAFAGQKSRTDMTVFREVAISVGHGHLRTITGAGTIRLDCREDLRGTMQIGILGYQTTGQVVDLPFVVPHHVPANTPIGLRIYSLTPAGTTITGGIYNPATGTVLAEDVDQHFLSVAGQRVYYAKLFPTSNGLQTPILLGYEVEVAGFTETTTPTPVVADNHLVEVDLKGQDLDPTHEFGSFDIQDPAGDLAILRSKSRIPAKLIVNDGGMDVVIWRGELAGAPATKMGVTRNAGVSGTGAAVAFPSPSWHRFHVQAVGQWARLKGKRVENAEAFQFANDLADPRGIEKDADGNPLGWKVSDIVKYLFVKCGVPTSEQDFPDSPLRIFPGEGGDASKLTLTVGKTYWETIVHFARLWLDWLLFFDPNAGSTGRGLWRAKEMPVAPFDPLWSFVEGPAAGHTYSVHPGAYLERETFIAKGTFTPRVAPPAGNRVVVTGGPVAKTSEGSAGYLQRYDLNNPISYNFNPDIPTADPDHPDYLGVEETVYYEDPNLGSKDAVIFIAYRIFNAVAHAQKWAEWVSPLVLMNDPDDALLIGGQRRPLRVGDVVAVNGVPCLLRSVNPAYDSDRVQLAHYEAVSLEGLVG